MNRHLYRGKRCDNGEWVTGYYLCVHGKHGIIEESFSAIIPQSIPGIDPATVEPVKEKPIFYPDRRVPESIYCPNCNYDLMGGIDVGAEHDPPFCWECGQALDWSEGSV